MFVLNTNLGNLSLTTDLIYSLNTIIFNGNIFTKIKRTKNDNGANK